MARKKNYRAALKCRNGGRFRIRARGERFGEKSAFRGPPLKTLLLREVVDDGTDRPLTDQLWMTTGKWSVDIREETQFRLTLAWASI